ncbi:MAG TPA: thiopeptide-type bacteriocin biosynthesis protein, partial [Kofleriaceae bacterium]|nr:thiopeptide-type bacteriocin biosynthesis protein [Kofleriaceae bacterium]
LPVARFLGALARAQGAGLSWSWGPADDAPFTPRVLAGRCVLCRARWRLSAQDVAALRAGDSGVRERWQLPRWIVVRDGDRELPIDLDNAYLREALLGEAATVVREMFPAADELGLDGDDGRFVHELQATYVRRDPVRAARFPTATAAQRSFPPGSEWLYVKWYAGARGVDEILAAIAPVVRELTAAGVSKRWFFVRFADPDWHLRVRLHGEPATLLATVLPALSRAVEPLREAGVIWKTQLDTYERELERYPAIEAAEHVFAADSDAVLAILEAYDDPFDLRRLAMCGVDRLLGDLGLDEAARLALVTRMRDHLGAEQHLGTDGKRRFGELFREREAALVAALTGEDEELALGRSALDGRSAAIAPVIDHLRGPEVAASLAHLHVNRMFAVAPRQQELVVYELMRRTYERLRYTRRSG